MWPEFDLLGAPIPKNHGEQGRPQHAFNPEIANKIRVLLCSGMKLNRISREVGLSAPTIRKVYFQNGKVNRSHAERTAVEEQRAKVMLLLDEAAKKGNVSAMKTQLQYLDQELARFIAAEEEGRRANEKPLPKGKKERDVVHADDAEAGLAKWLDDETAGVGESGKVH